MFAARGRATVGMHTLPTTEAVMTTKNAELVRQLFAAYEANDAAQMDALLAPEFIGHGLPPELGEGPAAMKATAALMHGALADCRCELDDVIADGDRVAVRYTTRARHVGELFGAAPSGRTVTFTGIEVFRVLDDKIVEYWGEANMSELFSEAPEPAAVS
jgi:predicted ester cyclase